MQVLRISHRAVGDAWREHERELIRRGVGVSLICAAVWNDGGTAIRFAPRGDAFASAARTFGSHPQLFLYDPRPLWRAFRGRHWDLLDVHEEACSLATSEVLLLARLCRMRAPIVLYSAQNIGARFYSPFRRLEQLALRQAAGVSVSTSETARILRRKGFPGAVSVMPVGDGWSGVAAAQHQLYLDVLGRPYDVADRTTLADTARRPIETALPGIDVVVISNGDPARLRRCLAPLAAAFALTVVDNASCPATRALVAELGGRYLDPGSDLGRAGGVNLALGALRSGSDVLLLDPDAAIDAADIRALQHALRGRPRLACVAPEQLDPHNGTAARVARQFPSPVGAWGEATGLSRLRRGTGFVAAAVLLLRAEALADVGGFDERFVRYSEQTDWQLRARQRGWQIAAIPGITATRAAADADHGRRETHVHASRELFIRKHHGALGWQVFRAAVVAGAAARVCLLRGARQAHAAERLRLYLRGPARAQARLETAEDEVRR